MPVCTNGLHKSENPENIILNTVNIDFGINPLQIEVQVVIVNIVQFWLFTMIIGLSSGSYILGEPDVIEKQENGGNKA